MRLSLEYIPPTMTTMRIWVITKCENRPRYTFEWVLLIITGTTLQILEYELLFSFTNIFHCKYDFQYFIRMISKTNYSRVLMSKNITLVHVYTVRIHLNYSYLTFLRIKMSFYTVIIVTAQVIIQLHNTGWHSSKFGHTWKRML